MPNSPECQPIADAISNLSTQEQAARDALPALAGIDKWKKMQELGTLRQQLADQQALLAECEKQHAADLMTQVVITDLPGNSGPNRIAQTWQLTSDGQVLKQTVTVQDGVANLLGSSVAPVNRSASRSRKPIIPPSTDPTFVPALCPLPFRPITLTPSRASKS